MKRRDFLVNALAAGALSSGLVPLLASRAAAATPPARVLVNVMLAGGPDLRHLFPPAFNPDPASVGYRFWRAKASAHAIGDTPASWQARWDNDYFHASFGGTAFGIRSNCGWLRQFWDDGLVAIVANAVGARTRDHAHCIMVLDQGNVTSGPLDFQRSGWGGRLAKAAGGNVLALTGSPRPFCYSPDPADANRHLTDALIAAPDMRDLALFAPAPGASPLASQARIARGLSAYYAAKRAEMSHDSVYYRFVDMERKLREFGAPITERLAATPIPPAIAALSTGGLTDPGFATQIRNVHDAFACADILNLAVASLEYNGWDSHRNQVTLIERKLGDLFGAGKAFDALYQSLAASAADNLVIVIAGEFGRQLRANGDGGTDHGEGNDMLVIGRRVRGGIYGDLFPEGELARLGDPSPQIDGLTEIDHIFGAVSDWVFPGSSATVFPRRGEARLEPGVDLTTLLV